MDNLSYFIEIGTVYKKKSQTVVMLTGAKLCQLEACNYVTVKKYDRPRINTNDFKTSNKFQVSLRREDICNHLK
jgi:hypothetical protein